MPNTASSVVNRYDELNSLLSKPETSQNQRLFKELSIELSNLGDAYAVAKQILDNEKELTDAQVLLDNSKDAGERDFYQETITHSGQELEKLKPQLKELTSEKDPNDKRNVIMEIRPGTGGEEAALFAADLYRMYLKYAEAKNWRVEQLSSSYSENGGYKEVICAIKGKDIYGQLKYESGVHRVQRVPATESQGRIHTSTASVVVLPEVEDFEIEVKDEDIRTDIYRSSGPGGQSVNTTDSAVRITHIPTGIVVSCQDEKSQLKNKNRAMVVLKSRLYDLELSKRQQEDSSKRQAAIKGGDRSAKIRTYNYPQSRVTDHRIKVTWHNLTQILNGDLEEVIKTTKEKINAA
jgi:peptide chain release factor 1